MKHFLFSPRNLGGRFPFGRAYFSDGLVQPPRWPVMITRDGEIGIVIPVLPLTQGNFNNYTLEEPENDGLEDDFRFPRVSSQVPC